MAEADQRIRSKLSDVTAEMQRTDAANTARLREIVAAIGWPTKSKVGAVAEHRAWLLVQHADADRDFQRACLELMKREASTEVCPEHIAYLEDRLAVAAGRPQLYGTQLRPSASGELEPLPLQDEERVDHRRAEVGLPPIADYLATARATRKG